MPSSSSRAGFSSRGLISTKLDIVSSRGGAGTRGAYPCPDGTRIERRAGMAFSVPDLTYAFDALEPHIDARTMEIHHDKHHAAYVTNLNAALEGTPHAEQSLDTILTSLDAIADAFGGVAELKAAVNDAGVKRFGSGWTWLVWDGTGLEVKSTPNQDTPVMDGQAPILGIDVWEHAYYLNYQNRRPDYLEAWWNVVDWDAVGAKLAAARG